VLELASKFVRSADEVFRMQNLQTGTDPECRLFQKFSELGHYRSPGTTRQGTYAVSPSGVLLASVNSNDPKRIADMMQKSLAKWQTLTREERLLPYDPKTKVAEIKRPERYYPEDGLVLYVTSRDLPREPEKAKLQKQDWRLTAWNQDYAWFTKTEAKQFLPPPKSGPKGGEKGWQVGQKHDLPLPIVHRIVCAHLIDNVRGQTAPFDEKQVKKARLTAEITEIEGSIVWLHLEGQTLTDNDRNNHGLDMRLLGKAMFDTIENKFLLFELVAVGSRWGGTTNNSRKGDFDTAPIGILFTLAGDGPCERIAPAFNNHKVYRPVIDVK
jgi:hypothetical protein